MDSLKKCAICRKPVVDKYKPFCSERCKMIDLGNWLGGNYKVKEPENEGEEASSPKPDSAEDGE